MYICMYIGRQTCINLYMFVCMHHICMHLLMYGGKNLYVSINTNMHESIYVYVSQYVCRETCMILYLCVHAYMYLCAFMYVGMHGWIYTCRQTCIMYTLMDEYRQNYMNVCMYVCTYIYIHTYRMFFLAICLSTKEFINDHRCERRNRH